MISRRYMADIYCGKISRRRLVFIHLRVRLTFYALRDENFTVYDGQRQVLRWKGL